MRKLSSDFIQNLQTGLLASILQRVKDDDTLFLAIRNHYINIYYRGGNLLRVQELNSSKYRCYFDPNYLKTGHLKSKINALPSMIQNNQDAMTWVEHFAYLKEVMDLWFRKNRKSEREYQQTVARENNFSNIANETEYYITDIEYDDSSIGAKADLLAIKWKASDRSKARHCIPVFIEMKYGDQALTGKSGIEKHLMDFDQQINDKNYAMIVEMMQSQFKQLVALGLIEGKAIDSGTIPQLNDQVKPEVILLLANHNPRSNKLANLLQNPALITLINKLHVKFFVSHFAGYGLHETNMLDLTTFKRLL